VSRSSHGVVGVGKEIPFARGDSDACLSNGVGDCDESMKHTELRLRNYAGMAIVMLSVGLVIVGFGAVDLAMIAPKGIEAVAAVGAGDILVSAIFAFFSGGVDVFGSRVALSEGEGSTARRLPVLSLALALLLVAWQLVGVIAAQGVEPLLRAAGQKHELIPLIGSYVSVRMYGVAAAMLYVASIEALRICGMKNWSVLTVCIGFVVNAVLDWAFLYTGLRTLFSSPESAVAAATVFAHLSMGLFGGMMYVRFVRPRPERLQRPAWSEISAEFRTMIATATGLGIRHVNDWVGAVIPMIFIGTLGTASLAAASVATKIYTLYCRIPQACTSASYVFYGYAVGRRDADIRHLWRRLLTFAAVPTIVATVAVLASAPWLVRLFGGPKIDAALAELLLFAYVITIPFYLMEKTADQMLTVHQGGRLLSVASTVTTYFIAIPFAAIAVFVLSSSFLALLGGGLASLALAAVFWRALIRKWSEPDSETIGVLAPTSSGV